jgi:hypothetical protein
MLTQPKTKYPETMDGDFNFWDDIGKSAGYIVVSWLRKESCTFLKPDGSTLEVTSKQLRRQVTMSDKSIADFERYQMQKTGIPEMPDNPTPLQKAYHNYIRGKISYYEYKRYLDAATDRARSQFGNPRIAPPTK